MEQKLNKNKMNMPPTESGRSMVEMLGVLAIMGILTIGGIAGFNYAMDKHNANEILDGVNKRAIALSTYTMLGTNITSTTLNAEFSNRIGDSTVALDADNTGFDLIVSGVSEAVCDHVLNNGAKMASEILLKEGEDDRVVWKQGVKSDHTCAEKDNEIVFAFNAALDGTKTADTITCGYCQHKENNTCVADERCDNGCPGSRPMKNISGICLRCQTNYAIITDAAECAKCSNREMLHGTCARICTEEEFRNNNDACVSCNSTNASPADAAECAKCSERERLNDGYCALKECPDGTIKQTYHGICQPCSTGAVFATTECAKCPNREIVRGNCALSCPDGTFRAWETGYSDRFGSCESCSLTIAYKADATECAKCSEREMLDNGYCALKKCPDEMFRNSDGYCALCSAGFSTRADATECAKCSGREMLSNGYCTLIECPDRHFRDSETGTCQQCQAVSAYKADAEKCAKCTERVRLDNGYCCLTNKTKYYTEIDCKNCGGAWDEDNRKCS